MSEERKEYGPTGREQIEELKRLHDKAAEGRVGLELHEALRFMEIVVEALAVLEHRIDALQKRIEEPTIRIEGPEPPLEIHKRES